MRMDQESIMMAVKNFFNSGEPEMHGPEGRWVARTWSQTYGDYQRSVHTVRLYGLVFSVAEEQHRQKSICTGLDEYWTVVGVRALCTEKAWENYWREVEAQDQRLAEDEALAEFAQRVASLTLTSEDYASMSREQRLMASDSTSQADWQQERWEEYYEDHEELPPTVTRAVLRHHGGFREADAFLEALSGRGMSVVRMALERGLSGEEALAMVELEARLHQDELYEELARVHQM